MILESCFRFAWWNLNLPLLHTVHCNVLFSSIGKHAVFIHTQILQRHSRNMCVCVSLEAKTTMAVHTRIKFRYPKLLGANKRLIIALVVHINWSYSQFSEQPGEAQAVLLRLFVCLFVCHHCQILTRTAAWMNVEMLHEGWMKKKWKRIDIGIVHSLLWSIAFFLLFLLLGNLLSDYLHLESLFYCHVCNGLMSLHAIWGFGTYTTYPYTFKTKQESSESELSGAAKHLM